MPPFARAVLAAATVPLALTLAAVLALAPPAAAAPVPVEVNVHVLNFGNFDVTKGTYIMDLYLWFEWRPEGAAAGFSPEGFELMNGRASSRERIADLTRADGAREVWFRVQANLYSDPDFGGYPFDAQRLSLQLEDAVWPVGNLTYVPGVAALDPAVRVAGYRVAGFQARIEDHAYGFGDTHSRAVFTMEVTREVLGTAVKTFLPPLVFMLVSGLGFLFGPDKLGLRVGAGTSMLISAVMFHISQTAALPPLGTLTFIDKLMMATYAFLASSLAVTALVSVNTDHWKQPGLTERIGRLGFAATVAAPLVVLALVWLI